jgi:hypothetical protein
MPQIHYVYHMSNGESLKLNPDLRSKKLDSSRLTILYKLKLAGVH